MCVFPDAWGFVGVKGHLVYKEELDFFRQLFFANRFSVSENGALKTFACFKLTLLSGRKAWKTFTSLFFCSIFWFFISANELLKWSTHKGTVSLRFYFFYQMRKMSGVFFWSLNFILTNCSLLSLKYRARVFKE